jgi:hypothetical protein
MKQKPVNRCPATITDRSGTYRCSLEEGHRRKHLCLDDCWFGWTNEGAARLAKELAPESLAKKQQSE